MSIQRAAVLSPCGVYRFRLTREDVTLFPSDGAVLFVLNNPSTADATVDDQTVRKAWGFTRSWGFNRMCFVNTNPHRSTDPKLAVIPDEAILTENDTHLRFAAAEASLVVCAWGTKAEQKLVTRALAVLRLQKPLHVIELSTHGIPKHPLYLRGNLPAVPWHGPDADACR